MAVSTRYYAHWQRRRHIEGSTYICTGLLIVYRRFLRVHISCSRFNFFSRKGRVSCQVDYFSFRGSRPNQQHKAQEDLVISWWWDRHKRNIRESAVYWKLQKLIRGIWEPTHWAKLELGVQWRWTRIVNFIFIKGKVYETWGGVCEWVGDVHKREGANVYKSGKR